MPVWTRCPFCTLLTMSLHLTREECEEGAIKILESIYGKGVAEKGKGNAITKSYP